ncbi:unnamed protein product [Cylindrotheca closterium]|uniref:Lcl C-terminal domain-containing protein n=1 Tax=Cylindrotheca closterium TaxID=2856 RepID=A0AAD2PUA2_9STRA|nr:unnamed protein product [Cylindrotheca closterium]
MIVQTTLACVLLSTRVALASNVYPVTDTNQRYCYDSYHASSTSSNEEDPDSDTQERAHRRAQELALTNTRNLDGFSCPGSGQDASYSGLKQLFQNNDDGTISDLNTGLMWTQHVYSEGLTYSQVESELSIFQLGGHSDWRVPTIKELYTLSEFNGEKGNSRETNIPYIDNTVFNVKYGNMHYMDGQVWSSTQYTGAILHNPNSDCNFGFNSIDGRIECNERSSTRLNARFVRGHTNIGRNAFSTSGNSTDIIVDTATGLEWARSDSGVALDWDEALDYCNDLELGGLTDWKLPDAHELQSIVDYSRSPDATDSPAIDSLFYSTQIENEAGQADWGWYWTSTTHLDGIPLGSNAVYIAFGRAMGHLETHDGTAVGAVDLHGAGAQRSDRKVGATSPKDIGPPGDCHRVYNYARCVRGSSSPSAIA